RHPLGGGDGVPHILRCSADLVGQLHPVREKSCQGRWVGIPSAVGGLGSRWCMASAEELYRELAPAVLGYLRASGSADPEDRLGEVFLQVARDLPRFRDRDDEQ